MNWILDVNGQWDIYIDENNPELKNINYCDIKASDLWSCITVPGCWDTRIDSKAFEGPVWYRKQVNIPRLTTEGNRIILKFEAVSYYCEVYVNEQLAGDHEGMWDSFTVDITDKIKYDEANTLVVRVYKQGYEPTDVFPFRQTLAGFIPDVLCTFGGIWGKVTLEEKPAVYIETAYVEADIQSSTAKVHIQINNPKQKEKRINVEVVLKDKEHIIAENATICIVTDKTISEHILEISLDNPILWELDNPHLYNAEVKVMIDEDNYDIKKKRFGMREIRAEGRNILLNGKPVYIRGILHWGYYPETIHPNVGKETIREELEKIKEFGFNAVKHCLYIPREDYFELTDEMGILTWLELPLWLPEVTEKLKSRMEFEYPRIIRQVAGHPSIIMFSLGCELNSDIDSSTLEEMYHLAKDCSGNLLVRDNSGSGECYGGLKVDYADFYDYHFYGDLHNMENLIEVFTPEWREVRPWLFGEFCDIDTYRDIRKVKSEAEDSSLWWTLKDRTKNPVSDVKPDFQCHLLEDRMLDNNLAEETEMLEKLSINHAMIHRKNTLELTRRFSEIRGYNITAIRDVPIATSGIFDDFMKAKFDQKDFRKFNDEIVMSPAWDLNRTWINGDRVLNKDRYNFWCEDFIGLHIVISNFSSKVLSNIKLSWKAVKDNGEVVAKDSFRLNRQIEIGSVEEIVYVSFNAPQVDLPSGISIIVNLVHDSGSVENDWRVWIYHKDLLDTTGKEVFVYDLHGIFEPLKSLYNLRNISDNEEIKNGIVLTTHISQNIELYLKEGGKVFYIQRGKGYLPYVKTSFWRESFCRYYAHRTLRSLVNDEYRDLQLFGLAPESAIDTFNINKEDITDITPIIRRVDSRQYNASDYLVEMRVGKGTLIATTLRFEGGIGKQPNSLSYNNLGIYMIDQIIRYLILGKE
jgi:hypothetical protein